MVQVWDCVDNDFDICCCIFIGVGGYFCVGMDFKVVIQKLLGDFFKDGSYDLLCIDVLFKGCCLIKLLIVVVEGFVIVGGIEILQGIDIWVVGESVKFGIFEVKWSLYLMGGLVVWLVWQIFYILVCDLLLIGWYIIVVEVKEMGLIGYVVFDGQVLIKVLEFVDVILVNGFLVVQVILWFICEIECMFENEVFKIDIQIGIKVFLFDDVKEGLCVFVEKCVFNFQNCQVLSVN